MRWLTARLRRLPGWIRWPAAYAGERVAEWAIVQHLAPWVPVGTIVTMVASALTLAVGVAAPVVLGVASVAAITLGLVGHQDHRIRAREQRRVGAQFERHRSALVRLVEKVAELIDRQNASDEFNAAIGEQLDSIHDGLTSLEHQARGLLPPTVPPPRRLDDRE